MQHNNTELTRVRGSNPEKPYSMTLDYGGSLEQLGAVIDGSEYCEQEVAYHCRRSRLLNTPGKKHPSWAPSHVPHRETAVWHTAPNPGLSRRERFAIQGAAPTVVPYATRKTPPGDTDGLVLSLVPRP